MTNEQALKANLRPYYLPSDSLEFLLLQQELSNTDAYTSDNEKLLMQAVVNGLRMVITLEVEKDAGSEHHYDTDKIQERINSINEQYELEGISGFIDRTDEW